MKYLLWGILAIIGLYCLDRISLWAEGCGWIYYRRRRANSSTVGNALLELQTILEPSKRHVIEERVKQGGESQESGDKPKPGSR
jgi:hypothetical protein